MVRNTQRSVTSGVSYGGSQRVVELLFPTLNQRWHRMLTFLGITAAMHLFTGRRRWLVTQGYGSPKPIRSKR